MLDGFKRIEQTRGPFDPGGQPDTRSGQPLELGFFAWNIKGGMTASRAVLRDPGRLQNYWEWPNSRHLVELAERVGFDYQVPFGRWLGQGGETDYNGAALDFLASAAATAPITTRLGLFSTAHITYRFHPLHLAKFGATIDHMSGGRWGLNIVSGSQAREMAAFGFKEPIGHDEAYEMADEFCCLMKALWSEHERISFEGDYYQSYGALVTPKPVRDPRPVLMSAGRSDVGIDFAARHVDWLFTAVPRVEQFPDKVEQIHARAERYGRRLRVATMIYVIMDRTDELAQETYDWVEAEIDRDAVLNFIAQWEHGADEERVEDDPYGGVGKEMYTKIALGIEATHVIGSFETVAEKIRALHETGLESLLVCFFDPQKGLHQTQDDLMPILERMGLRTRV